MARVARSYQNHHHSTGLQTISFLTLYEAQKESKSMKTPYFGQIEKCAISENLEGAVCLEIVNHEECGRGFGLAFGKRVKCPGIRSFKPMSLSLDFSVRLDGS